MQDIGSSVEVGMGDKITVYDIIILGAGPAGLTAAIYATRSGWKTLVLDKMPMAGGTVANVPIIENWPGTSSISGQEFSNKLAEHAEKTGAELKLFDEVTEVDFSGKVKKIKTAAEELEAHAIIITMGTTHADLGVPGEEKLKGMGVSYCAPCDGSFFKDKDVAVIGGGNSALGQALYLAKIARTVTLIHRRDIFRAEEALIDQVKAEKKVLFLFNSIVSEIVGEEKVNGVKVKNVLTGKENLVKLDGVFIYAGLNPNTAVFGKWLKLDELGFILTDENMRTNVPGVFAAGDVRATPLRQIVTAASDGAIAAMAAGKYVRENKQ